MGSGVEENIAAEVEGGYESDFESEWRAVEGYVPSQYHPIRKV
jgi:hypothetical protein